LPRPTSPPATARYCRGPSPSAEIGVVFEDEGETGYFHALDFARAANPIVDALHIHNVQSVADKQLPSQAQILWSEEASRPHC